VTASLYHKNVTV